MSVAATFPISTLYALKKTALNDFKLYILEAVAQFSQSKFKNKINAIMNQKAAMEQV